MMIALRGLGILIFTVLLTGCDVVDDIKALKADIRALRIYLMSLPAPGQCPGPGVNEYSTSCYYKLEITDDTQKAKGVFSGKIAPEVYRDNLQQCEESKKTLRPEFKHLPYECLPPDNYPDKDIEYTFHVDGDTSSLGKGTVSGFKGVFGTRHLMIKGEPKTS